MQTRKITLSARHEHVSTTDQIGNPGPSVTVAGVRTPLIAWTPPVGTFYGVSRVLLPVLKLFQTGGAQIAAGSRVFVGKMRPGDSSPTFAPGSIDYYSFFDLTTAQQRNADNRRTLEVDLGAHLVLREEESLVLFLDSPTAFDPLEPGTAIELTVGYQTV